MLTSFECAHHDGLPVEFVAEAISTFAASLGDPRNPKRVDGFETFQAMNPHDDSIGFDDFVAWLIDSDCAIQRIEGYADWLQRFETGLRALPDKQRQNSLLPLLHKYRQPESPVNASVLSTDRSARRSRMRKSFQIKTFHISRRRSSPSMSAICELLRLL